MAQEFYRHLLRHAEKDPGHLAVIDGESRLTYRELLDRVERFAGGLETLDLKPGSKLGLLLLNRVEYLVALFGAFFKGLPVVPFNFLLSQADMGFIARDAGVDIAVVDAAFVKPEAASLFALFRHKILAGEADPAPLGQNTERFDDFLARSARDEGSKPHAKDPDIPSALLYTSGTTAKPKGVMLEESQFDLNARSVLAHLDIGPRDRIIVALPLFHSFGNIMALLVFRAGGTLILLKQFAPKAILSAIAEHKATILPIVPTIYSFLVQLHARGGYDASSLRFCVSGGASLPRALLKDVEETLGAMVLEGYGLTETSPVIAVNTTAAGSRPGSVGPVVPHVEVKIVDEGGRGLGADEIGEILVRGPTVMKGYWKRPEENRETFTADGWLKTGDLGHRDEECLLYISAGRKKDIIIRAGENVSPLAIENALMNHPALAEAAVVGLPDERVGERVKACVALREGSRADSAELRAHCIKELPAFMVPDLFEFHDALPKNATGKVMKNVLREGHSA